MPSRLSRRAPQQRVQLQAQRSRRTTASSGRSGRQARSCLASWARCLLSTRLALARPPMPEAAGAPRGCPSQGGRLCWLTCAPECVRGKRACKRSAIGSQRWCLDLFRNSCVCSGEQQMVLLNV